MVPIELYIKYELKRRASKKILVSWFSSSLKAPIPSESIISTVYYFFVSLSSSVIGLFQIHKPFVQGFIVGPTPKPDLSPVLFNRILFRRKLLPVLYFPATAIIPTFVSQSSGD